jgi:beta-carotene 3-hydroxylase
VRPAVAVLIVVGSFLAMEPITAAIHRWVMHGVGEWFHRSHHRSGRVSGWERNDWYPVFFAAIVMAGLWLGFNREGLSSLVPVGVGVTAYGVAYALVHDGYIHRRVDPFGGHRFAALERLADAHRIHHLYSAAPYGMLLPIVPTELKERAARTQRDPFTDRDSQTTASAAAPGPV